MLHPLSSISAGVGTKELLTPSDFTMLGFWEQKVAPVSTVPLGPALTHRRVNGKLRFLTRGIGGGMREYDGDVPLGSPMSFTPLTGDTGGFQSPFYALSWDEGKQRLWTTTSGDYTANFIQTQIFTRTIDANGVMGNRRGPWGLQGVDMKCVYGGMVELPGWFRQQHNLPPYVVGFGGYTSLLNQGGGASLGLTAYGMPDPEPFPDGTILTPLTLSDHRKGDRGKRITTPINYFDGGDPRPNPTTPPTVPPIPSSWQSPINDGSGLSWWVWGDSYYNTVCFIETATKYGLVAFASLGGGKCFYMQSTLHYDSRVAEMHIFDPLHLAEVASGLRPASKVQPTYMQKMVLPGFGNVGLGGNSTNGNVGGATYDAVDQRLYFSAIDYTNTAKVTGKLFALGVAT